MENRYIGLDLARALAIIMMVIVNYKLAMEVESGSAFLLGLTGIFEGRAAALFVLLAGIGIAISTNRARREGKSDLIKQKRLHLIKRGGLLIMLGLCFSLIWPADILHLYGAYFILAALFISLTNKQLLICGVSCLLLFPVLLGLFDYDAGWHWPSLTYINFWSVDGFIKQLFFNGFHPIFPWFSFLLFGLFLGRLNLWDKQLRKKMLVIALATFTVLEFGLLVMRGLVSEPGGLLTLAEREELLLVLSSAMIPPMPQYVISATCSAVIILVCCLQLAQSAKHSRIMQWLAKTGRLALSIYVGHIIIGLGLFELLGILEQPSIAISLVGALVFIGCCMVFSVWWLKRFNAGPLEGMFKKLVV
ncbi:DUF418 domain-containing protein [Psychrobium sp. 1_MG-2023]|uniref:DUF418 domain-containing protein n=1 Tax=Psychrobium sp. 1_MG-2023 TaxID=3062624 RepID=UPI000C32CAA7|nr:heparan-alpha-glucosaminide N-acetyltransferase domain-containing protein [Psychrobium sp. 1_MG-2023]MDP2561915.1 heparan-alpha-glucosaminide N-acetyltransferase domain-containing protein [Psychrobium sp. 1_MG-2023]PKF59671.1 hypothetical protein CW748_00260 [Alteromonadales bacterium alter-6D02]